MNRHAVQRAAVWYYSASQLKSADSCIRIWAWEKLCGYIEPSGPAAALGTDVHEVLERWTRDGLPPNLHSRTGEIASAGLRHLPFPGPELEVEREFHIRVGNHHYRGKVDLGFVDVTGLPWVIDHKTTRDFVWMLSPEDLIDDIQALIYAKEALDRYGVDEVHLRWVYYRTTKPYKSEPVDLRVTRADVDLRWPVIDEIASSVDRVRLNVLDPLSLPPNANACAKFGGCPHIKRCNLTAQERMKSIMTQQAHKGDIRAKMAARVANRKQQNGAAPQAVVTMAPPANQPPMQQQQPVQYQQPVQQQQYQQQPPQQVQYQQQPAPVAAQPVQQQPVQQQPAPVAAQPVQQQPVQQQPMQQQPVQQQVQQQPPQQQVMQYQQQPVQQPQNVVPMNPPEQPPMETQLSSTIVEEQAAPTRANEQEGAAATKTRKTRTKKADGFVIGDKRTAIVLAQLAGIMSNQLNQLQAQAFIESLYPEK